MTTLTAPPNLSALLTRLTGDEKHDWSSLSTLDVLWVLYDRILGDDDRFLLSKGHGPAAYYAVLAAKGFIPEEWLDDLAGPDSRLGHHPDRLLVPGVEISSGSLGHGLPIAVGVALALRAGRHPEPRVVVLAGDAELNEGSNWEAILLAPALGLRSLTLVVIDNRSSSIPMTPWEERLGSFGWDVAVVDGRDHAALEAALARRVTGRPNAVVADIRSRG